MMGSRIYTRGGDRGETGTLGAGRVPKSSTRIEAVGSVDELNAVIGLAIANLGDAPAATRLADLQPDLFAIGSSLITPLGAGRALPPLPLDRPTQMEHWIDEVEATLPPLHKFIMPGGSPAGAALHLARTVCRRAERAVIRLAREDGVRDGVIIYLNRLSDLLFTLAREENQRSGASEVQWLPELVATDE